ncbi:FxSxx-COOH system tetratricopeptide repeat protein [Nocardiopsis sp. LOL_012]|uniref:FxSxx-COOH system tetratricopeptide repeat protein n=1 Tax=Nocardiopsis sp. LOL_012 TaxID=3345409 RepID=UPI003A891E66
MDAVHLAALRTRYEAPAEPRDEPMAEPVVPPDPAGEERSPHTPEPDTGAPPGGGNREEEPEQEQQEEQKGTHSSSPETRSPEDSGKAEDTFSGDPRTFTERREVPPPPPPAAGGYKDPPFEAVPPGRGREAAAGPAAPVHTVPETGYIPGKMPERWALTLRTQARELVAAPSELSQVQGWAASLRPFHIHIPDGAKTVLDRERTAHDYATALLENALRPAGERGGVPVPVMPVMSARRRLAITLTCLVDNGVSMLFQHPLAGAAVEAARRSGIFRDVREVHFDSEMTGAPDLSVPMGSRGQGHAGTDVILVLTNGVGRAWRDGGFRRWLADTAKRNTIAIVHLLNPRQWPISGINTVPAELTAPRSSLPALANGLYRAALSPDASQWGLSGAGEASGPDLRTCVPVLSLNTERIYAWAMFATGRDKDAVFRAQVLPVPGRSPDAPADEWPRDAGPEPPQREAKRLVRNFASQASPSAFRIAVALAAVPLHVRFMDPVADHVLGRLSRAELTEILFSGLVRPITEEDGRPRGEGPAWDFLPGVRQELLARGGRVSRIRSVLRLVVDGAEKALDRTDPWFATLRAMLDGRELRQDWDFGSNVWVDHTWEALKATALTSQYSDTRLMGDLISQYSHKGSAGNESLLGPVSDSAIQSNPSGSTGGGADMLGPHMASDNPEGGVSMARFDEKASKQDVAGQEGRASWGPHPEAVWVRVPRRGPSFVGREQILADLASKLRIGHRQAITALRGTAGVGKTEIAKQYIYLHSKEYDLVCWIPSHQENLIRESFAEIAEKLNLGYVDAANDHVVRGVLEALRQGRKFPKWLLVFDNAEGQEKIERFLPVAGEGHVIITSRDSSWRYGGDDTFLEVDKLPREKSIELLKIRGPEGLSDDEADRLAEEFDDLPLGLNQVAVWLRRSGMGVSEYLTLLETERLEVIGLLEPDDPNYPVPLVAAWNFSLKRLSQESPAALQLLQVCAYMSPTPISRKLFRKARSIDAPDELRAALSDPHRLAAAIMDIDRYSLIQTDHRKGTITLHQLARDSIQKLMTPEERENRRHCAHQVLASNDPQDTTSEALREYAELLPHAWACEVWDCESPWSRDLVIRLCQATLLKREYAEVLELGGRARDLWSDRLGPTDRDTLRIQIRLSEALRGKGELTRARELCETTMRTIGEVSGKNSAEYMDADIQHARNLRMSGRFAEALDFSQKNYDRRVDYFSRNHPDALKAAHFLAFDLKLVGRTKESLKLYRDTWNLKQEVLGPDDASTRATADGYSDVLMESGNYREAAHIQKELVDHLLGLSDPDDVSVLSLQSTLTTMLRRSGDLQGACDLSGHVLRMFRDKRGEGDIDVIYASLRHSLDLLETGEIEKSLELSETAVKWLSKIWGEDHAHVAAARVNQAITLRRLERFAEAKEQDEWAMALFLQRLGDRHPMTLSCAISIGNDLFWSGDTSGAVESDEKSFESCGDILGVKHPITLLARRNLLIGRNSLQGVEADDIQKLKSDYEEIMGENHPATLSIGGLVRGESDIYISAL